MKIDLYTKTILTVIAACLVWMCVTRGIPAASAQGQQLPPPARVMLVDQNGAPIPTAQGLRVNTGPEAVQVTIANQSLPVTVATRPLPVSLISIERQGSWQPIAVDVMRSAPTLAPVP